MLNVPGKSQCDAPIRNDEESEVTLARKQVPMTTNYVVATPSNDGRPGRSGSSVYDLPQEAA